MPCDILMIGGVLVVNDICVVFAVKVLMALVLVEVLAGVWVEEWVDVVLVSLLWLYIFIYKHLSLSLF